MSIEKDQQVIKHNSFPLEFQLPFFMVLSSLVRRNDRSFVLHLLEPAINRCLYGDLWNLGVDYRYGRCLSNFDLSVRFAIPLI